LGTGIGMRDSGVRGSFQIVWRSRHTQQKQAGRLANLGLARNVH
jgi:hypothetical protein